MDGLNNTSCDYARFPDFEGENYRVTILITVWNQRRVGVESSQICPKCGRTIPEGQIVCLCSLPPRRRYWLHSRETILLLCVLGLIIAFAVTGFAARLYHSRRAELARSWFDRANAELKAGRAEAALSDFRTAIIYGQHELPPEQQQEYELEFVQALIATGRTEEARSYLLDLWERGPGDSRINLELARLASQTGNDADAKRYYNSAIYGIWGGNAEDVLRSRTETRLELYHYLLDRGEKTEAESELLAIAAATPPDASSRAQVGRLMLQVGLLQRALDQFEQALRLDNRNYEALAGAGEASFQLGNDRDAVRYLGNALREDAQQKRRPGSQADSAAHETEQAQAMQDLAIAQETLALDPNRPGLDPMERAARAIRAYDAAVTRIESCAKEHGIALPEPSRNLTPFTDAASDELAEVALAKHIEQLDPLMEFIYGMESAATDNCGSPSDSTNAAIARLGAKTHASRP
jgi:tetratricopeptide (TPR) repeat protein